MPLSIQLSMQLLSIPRYNCPCSSCLYCSVVLGTAKNGSERLFCVRNGSVPPREEDFTKQTQIMLLEGWCAEDVA
jgi:hypothetical protein